MEVMRIRSLQILTNILLRSNNVVCAPHMRCSFDDGDLVNLNFDRKWSIFEKASAGFGQTLAYVVVRCKKTYKGALLPLDVSSTETGVGHANMIFIDLRNDQAECYLFEPNGESFVSKTNAKSKIKSAIRVANKLLGKMMISPSVHLANVKGVQSAFGYEKKVTGRYTYETWHGIGICGAVTFWTMYHWLRSSNPSFPDYAEELARKIESNTDMYRTNILDFMVKMTELLLSEGNDQNKHANTFSERTFRALKRDIKSRLHACTCEGTEVDIIYDVSLGSIRGGGTLEFSRC